MPQLSPVNQRNIWIARNPDTWICNVYVVYVQQITLQVKNKGGLGGYITIVYGLNTIGERTKQWQELEQLHIGNVPWLLPGDFNIARFTNEKVGGRALNSHQLSSFNDS